MISFLGEALLDFLVLYWISKRAKTFQTLNVRPRDLGFQIRKHFKHLASDLVISNVFLGLQIQ